LPRVQFQDDGTLASGQILDTGSILGDKRKVGMSIPDGKTYIARTLCAMGVVPVAALALYPLIYLVLPESMQRLADLPRDLTIVLLFSEVTVPLCGVWLYRRARQRLRVPFPGTLRERLETRDVL